MILPNESSNGLPQCLPIDTCKFLGLELAVHSFGFLLGGHYA